MSDISTSLFLGELEKVATGARWAEGPLWLPERGSLIYSDIKSNKICEYIESTGELRDFELDAHHTNGRTRTPDGTVIECSHLRRAVQRRTGVGPDSTGRTEVIVDSMTAPDGRTVRLNSPNDVVVSGDGTIWFTDPAYGIENEGEGRPGTREYGDLWVFRFDPATGELRPAVTDVAAPNGLAFSPDESLLYVADSSGASADSPDGEGHQIRAYEVTAAGRCKNGRQLAVIEPHIPDGIKVDTAGRIWTSSGDSVQVLSPAGELIDKVAVPEVVANLCFGGADLMTLYITATSSLYRIRVDARGAEPAQR